MVQLFGNHTDIILERSLNIGSGSVGPSLVISDLYSIWYFGIWPDRSVNYSYHWAITHNKTCSVVIPQIREQKIHEIRKQKLNWFDYRRLCSIWRACEIEPTYGAQDRITRYLFRPADQLCVTNRCLVVQYWCPVILYKQGGIICHEFHYCHCHSLYTCIILPSSVPVDKLKVNWVRLISP